MSNDISYFEAWRLWFSGVSVNQFCLWGMMSILSLGRYGKVLELLSSVLIITEIIGSDKLYQLSREIKAKIVELKIRILFKKQLVLTASEIEHREKFIPLYVELKNWLFRTKKFIVLKLLLIFLLCSSILIYTIFVINTFTIIMLMLFVVISNDIFIYLWWKFVIPALKGVFKIVSVLIMTLIKKSLSGCVKLLAFSADNKKIKILNLLLLVVGFHFDLLSS